MRERRLKKEEEEKRIMRIMPDSELEVLPRLFKRRRSEVSGCSQNRL